MMASDDEMVVDSRNPTTPKVRKFGTDLKTSSRANRSSAKKVVKVRKQQSATKKRSNKAAAQTASSGERRRNNASNNNDASDLAYSVLFAHGSIGLKLEPVVESMGREVGCRVLDFADGGEDDPGQARRSGLIRPGDLLVAINGRDVISWNYPDILALLRQTARANERNLAFRSVWTPEQQQDAAVPSTMQPKVVRVVEESTSTTPVRQRELSYNDSPSFAAEEEDLALTQSPAESVLHSHFLSGFQPVESKPFEEIAELKPDVVTELVPTVTEEEEEESGDSHSVETAHSVEPNIDDDNSCFSPSRVKELSMSSTNGRTSPPTTKPLSNVVKTVYNSVAPAAGVVASSSYSLTSSLTAAMSVKLGEALVGHKSRDFDSAVQLKMQLLSELSQAKVTLDRNLEEQKRLEDLGQLLTQERDSEREAREVERQAREAEQEARQEAETDLEAVKDEKAKLELQLQTSKRKTDELSEQLEAEKQKMRNTVKDGDVKVRELESRVALLSSQAKDRERLDNKRTQREQQELQDRLSDASSTIDALNDIIHNLQADAKEKGAQLTTMEDTVDSVRADAKAVEANLSRSLESAIETKEATENRLRDLECLVADKDEKVKDMESRLKQVAQEGEKMKKERDEALEKAKLLQTSVQASNEARARLESQLASTRNQAAAETESLKSTVSSLRTELIAKEASFTTVVQTTNALQGEYNARVAELSALKETGKEATQERRRVDEELKKAQRHTRELELLRAMISEKDAKLVSLGNQFSEARSCLEGMNHKLHEKIDTLSAVSDREQKLREENESLLCRISDLEGALEQVDHDRRSLEGEKQQAETNLSFVYNQMELLQTRLEKEEDSRIAASREVEELRESARTLAETNENLRVDLDLTQTKLAASGMSFLSKAATIEELRSVLATNDLTSACTTAELEALQTQYDGKLEEISELETRNSELVQQNETLATDIVTLNTSLAASETAKEELEEKTSFVEQQLIRTKNELESSQARVLQQEEEATSLRGELSRSCGVQAKATVGVDEQRAASEAHEKKLRVLNEEVTNSRALVSRAARDIAQLKDRHANELKRVKSELFAERTALEQAQELVVDRFKREVEATSQLSQELRIECETNKRKLSEALATVELQEERLYAERGSYNKENQMLVSRVQSLEREKSELDSSRRRSSQQVAFLSDQLNREKDNVSTLKQSHDLALEESRRLRNEIERMQKVHLEDIEQMLGELDSRTRDDAATVLAQKISDEHDAKVKDLERASNRAEKEAENLRCSLESARIEHERVAQQLRSQKSEIEQDLGSRLLEKEEEIASYCVCLDSTENSLAESNVARRKLEAKIVQTESQAADATSDSERLSKRLSGMEDDLSAMANEIEMLVVTNGQLERRLIEVKAARVAAEADSQAHREVASSHDKINAELNAKIQEIENQKSLLLQKVEHLKSDLYDSLVEKEAVEAEKVQVIQSLSESDTALRVSREAAQENDAERQLLRGQLNEVSEKLVASTRQVEEHKESVSKLSDELEKVRRETKVEIKQKNRRVEELESGCATFEKTIEQLEQKGNEGCTALNRKEEELASLKDEIDRLAMELTSSTSERKEVTSRANELKKRLEATESLLEDSKVSQEIAAKLEVSNRTLMNRVDELEAAQDEMVEDLNEAEAALGSSLTLSKELKQQVDARQVEVDRLTAQVKILESTITRMKSDRLLQEEATQQLRGELARAADVKVDRAVSSLKNESDSKARNLVELAAKLTNRSRLIAQSKLFERTLMNFIEKLLERIDFLLDTVSSHSLMLKSATRGKMGLSAEALDLALPQTRILASSSSCDSLVLLVSSAKKEFEEFKQELEVLKRGSDSDDTVSNTRLLSPLPTPKHTALSSNLSKMKSILQTDSRNDRSISPSRDQSLRETVDYMELQIDGLIADLFAARRALESKEEALAELEDLVSMQESEKETLDKNVNSMQLYIKEIEQQLAQESSSSNGDEDAVSPLDATKKAAMKVAAARALGNLLQRESNASASQALRKWSNNACALKAVDQQKFVAEALARQLEITREKVAILKSHHLKHSARKGSK